MFHILCGAMKKPLGITIIVLGVTSSSAATVGLGAVQVIATAVTTWLVDKSGRRLLLLVSY